MAATTTQTKSAPIANMTADLALRAFASKLLPGEELITAGATITSAPWWMLMFRGAAETSSAAVTILTNKRLVLTQTKSWQGKWTPETIYIRKEFQLADITKVEVKGSQLVIHTPQEVLKLCAYKQFGLQMTPKDFMADVLAYINAQHSSTAQRTAA